MSISKQVETIKIRSHWDAGREQWLFSVIDMVEVLTDSSIPKRYWSDLKQKLQKEGSETYGNIVRLKMEASDGKLRETDVADTETLLRIIQSIPSPKAEPFKQWLARTGFERMRAFANPEQSPGITAETRQKPERGGIWNQQHSAGTEALNILAGFWMNGEKEKPRGSALLHASSASFPKTEVQDWGED